ncbi:MAG: sulfotransferase [Leptolyngbyaceae cyanobacterium]
MVNQAFFTRTTEPQTPATLRLLGQIRQYHPTAPIYVLADGPSSPFLDIAARYWDGIHITEAAPIYELMAQVGAEQSVYAAPETCLGSAVPEVAADHAGQPHGQRYLHRAFWVIRLASAQKLAQAGQEPYQASDPAQWQDLRPSIRLGRLGTSLPPGRMAVWPQTTYLIPQPRLDPVFGLGLGKTGTTTLWEALNILGWSPGYHNVVDWMIAFSPSSSDSPTAIRYKRLAMAYPQAKFVLTVRDRDSWLRSRDNQRRRRPGRSDQYADVRKYLYGTPNPTPAKDPWDRYQAHVAATRSFFKGSGRMIELNICDGEGWDELCPFLDVKTPATPFPWANRGS